MLLLDNHHRVCIEVTASLGENFAAKLGRCVRFLHSEAGHEAPTSIVFLVAARSKDFDNARIDHGTEAKLVKQLNALGAEHPLGREALEHLYLVSWADWFPRPCTVNWDAFTDLRVRRVSDSQLVALNGRTRATREQADLTKFTALSASLLYQSPRWTWPANRDAFLLHVNNLGTTPSRPGNLDLGVWYTHFRELYGD